MIKPPEHSAGKDFDKARDWIGQQERQLTDAQQRDYDQLKQRQDKERQKQQQRLDAIRRELEDKAKQRKLKADLTLDPPVRTNDPHVRRLAKNAVAAQKGVEDLARVHNDQKVKALEAFERQREHGKEKSKDFKNSWTKAVEKAAKQTGHTNQRDLSKDFDNSR